MEARAVVLARNGTSHSGAGTSPARCFPICQSYLEGAPSTNSPFDQFATDRFNYPYTLRPEITEQRRHHQLRAIYLENEYLKCSVLPDIGGHVYTCIDKISGQPMFYANPSIKKARIGYRGAWGSIRD